MILFHNDEFHHWPVNGNLNHNVNNVRNCRGPATNHWFRYTDDVRRQPNRNDAGDGDSQDVPKDYAVNFNVRAKDDFALNKEVNDLGTDISEKEGNKASLTSLIGGIVEDPPVKRIVHILQGRVADPQYDEVNNRRDVAKDIKHNELPNVRVFILKPPDSADDAMIIFCTLFVFCHHFFSPRIVRVFDVTGC